uniref:Uncharacterized protein n=1 Tax=Populus trichocarpa TaxID=3694 RepID=A0A3N7HQL6_POPTR
MLHFGHLNTLTKTLRMSWVKEGAANMVFLCKH